MNIAIFASGAGSNAEVIIKTLVTFTKVNDITIALIVSNNPLAGVLKIAKIYNIPSEVLPLSLNNSQNSSSVYLDILTQYKIDFIVLAGYLKKIPVEVIKKYPQKIVNIHPALLPTYGGAGMYGMHVHNAIVAAGEKQSGITIHFVDEIYDNGKIVFQTTCNIDLGETAESLAKKIHLLEHQHYAREISNILLSQFPVK